MIATQIAIFLYPNDNKYLVLSDDISNASVLVENIKKHNVYTNAYFFRKKPQSKIKYFFNCIFGSNVCNIESGLKIDDLFAFNFDLYSHFIFAYFQKKNRLIKTHRFEEGILSYSVNFDESNFLKKAYRIRKLFGKNNMRLVCKDFYCLLPSLYKGELNAIQIPSVNTGLLQYKESLTKIFYNDNYDCCISDGFLYLSSIYNVDGEGKVDEDSVIDRISSLIYPAQLFVKPHPRDTKLCKNKNSIHVPLPIECFALLNLINKKIVFVSSFSGSLFNLSSLFGDRFKYIYVNNLCDCSKNELASYFSASINSLSKNELFKNRIIVMNDLSDIKKYEI